MRGFVLIAYFILLLSAGFNSGSNQPTHLSYTPVHNQVDKSHTFNNDAFFATDEMEDEEERINNALARKYIQLGELYLTPPDLFDLNYLNGFYSDRLSLGDLPDIYIAQRALRI